MTRVKSALDHLWSEALRRQKEGGMIDPCWLETVIQPARAALAASPEPAAPVIWARYVPEWGCMKMCSEGDFGAIEYRSDIPEPASAMERAAEIVESFIPLCSDVIRPQYSIKENKQALLRDVAQRIRASLAAAPAPAASPPSTGEVVDALLAEKPFVFDPATNFAHADDGGAPEHGVLWAPVERDATPKPPLSEPDWEAIYDMIAGGITVVASGNIEIDTDLPQRIADCIAPILAEKERALASEIEVRNRVVERGNDWKARALAYEVEEPSMPASGGVEAALRAIYEWYDRDGSVGGACNVFEEHRPALAVSTPDALRFKLGDRVTKTKGSSWTGRVVGTYSTALTPEGYAVESENEPGSVQIYPAAALTKKD